jgi:hypothetical protein
MLGDEMRHFLNSLSYEIGHGVILLALFVGFVFFLSNLPDRVLWLLKLIGLITFAFGGFAVAIIVIVYDYLPKGQYGAAIAAFILMSVVQGPFSYIAINEIRRMFRKPDDPPIWD